MRLFFSTLVLVFLAELGDKTQITGFSLASHGSDLGSIILGSTLALVFSSALAVFLGDKINKLVPQKLIKKVSGCLFLGVGAALIVQNFLKL